VREKTDVGLRPIGAYAPEGSPMSDVRCPEWKSDVGGREADVGGRMSEVGDRKSEVGIRKSEIGS
jgi:hypothetical protein